MATNILIVLTNTPDRKTAEDIARALVDGGLAACANILSPCLSMYHWNGKTETAEEFPLLVKTRADRYADVERVIRARHPNELPEIVAVPVTRGLPPYLDWVADHSARDAAAPVSDRPPPTIRHES